ncbi:flippase-like domain-containing protein [Candidatus Microgenomates bacterium]|nr:flippase-like domain-containing protein [Candidatus Microgenomates bacterium]
MVRKGGAFISLVSFLLGIVFLFIVFSVINPGEIIASLRKITLWQFLAILILRLAFGILGALKWRIILEFYSARTSFAYQHSVSFWKLYLYKLASFAVEYFTQVTVIGGQVAGVVLLRGERVPTRVGVAVMVIDSVTTSFITMMVSFVATTIFLLTRFSNGPVTTLVLLTFLILLLFLFAFLFTLRIGPSIKEKKKVSFWERTALSLRDLVLASSDFFKNNKRGVGVLLAVSLLGHAGVLLEIFLILLFLGNAVGILEAAIIETGYTFAFLTPISQALGTAEAAGAYTLSLLGYSAALGVGLTLILRVRHLLIGFLGIGVLIVYGVVKFPFKTKSERHFLW